MSGLTRTFRDPAFPMVPILLPTARAGRRQRMSVPLPNLKEAS